jgi:GTP diphosphokinase / guanosine-3',5'-bis(diphosphate) 3'-diphosphatase
MVHPLMVAHILAGMRMDLVTIETGLLHDLVEDTRMPPDEIRKGFGDEVAKRVRYLLICVAGGRGLEPRTSCDQF